MISKIDQTDWGKKGQKTQISDISNERRDITTDHTDTKRMTGHLMNNGMLIT